MDVKVLINGTEVVVPSEQLAKGIEAGSVEIKTDGLKVLKSEDFEMFQRNLSDTEYNKGKVAGEEMLIKAARENFGLSFEGKTLESFAEALKVKTLKDATIEPDKKVTELSKDIEKLRGNLTEWEQKYTGLQGSIQQREKQGKIDNLILSAIPKDGISIPADDIALIFKSRYGIELNETGGHIVKQGDNVLKNSATLSELTIKDVMAEFIKPYIKTPVGGVGGEDKTKANIGSMDAFIKEMESNGHNTNSIGFQKEMQKRIKEGTLKV
jgi:hypothetical protein